MAGTSFPMMNMQSLQANISVLTGENYKVWSLRVEDCLRVCEWWDVVSEGVTEVRNIIDLIEQQQIRISQERDKDFRALVFLRSVVSESILLRNAGCRSAKELWDTLKVEYVGSAQTLRLKKQTILRNFENFAMKDEENVGTAKGRFLSLVQQLKEFGDSTSTERLVDKFLSRFPLRFEASIAPLEWQFTNDLDSVSLEQVFNVLEMHEERHGNRREGEVFALKAERFRTPENPPSYTQNQISSFDSKPVQAQSHPPNQPHNHQTPHQILTYTQYHPYSNQSYPQTQYASPIPYQNIQNPNQYPSNKDTRMQGGARMSRMGMFANCRFCGRNNHAAEDCFWNDHVECIFCRKRGHTRRVCYEKWMEEHQNLQNSLFGKPPPIHPLQRLNTSPNMIPTQSQPYQHISEPQMHQAHLAGKLEIHQPTQLSPFSIPQQYMYQPQMSQPSSIPQPYVYYSQMPQPNPTQSSSTYQNYQTTQTTMPSQSSQQLQGSNTMTESVLYSQPQTLTNPQNHPSNISNTQPGPSQINQPSENSIAEESVFVVETSHQTMEHNPTVETCVVEAWKQVEVEKARVKKERKRVDIERKKAEKYRLQLESLRKEVEEVKLKFEEAIRKLEATKADVAKEKERAKIERAKIEEKKCVAKRKIMEETSRAEDLSRQLENVRRIIEKKQRENQKMKFLDNPETTAKKSGEEGNQEEFSASHENDEFRYDDTAEEEADETLMVF